MNCNVLLASREFVKKGDLEGLRRGFPRNFETELLNKFVKFF